MTLNLYGLVLTALFALRPSAFQLLDLVRKSQGLDCLNSKLVNLIHLEDPKRLTAALSRLIFFVVSNQLLHNHASNGDKSVSPNAEYGATN